MGTTLRPAHAILLALALLAAPAFAQEPGGDAPDGTTSAQAEYGSTSISGDLEVGSVNDVDCFAIYISNAAAFSASTVGGPDPNLDTKLYLWNGDANVGATTGIIFNDDEPSGTFLQSEIPAGSVGGITQGKYVICVTSYDVDPLNAANQQIFNYGVPFNQVSPPNPTNGDANLASWSGTLDDEGAYTIALTGVGPNPGTCSLAFVGSPTATFNPGPPRSVQFRGQVSNAGPGAKQVRLVVQYSGPGGISGTLTYGPQTIPQGGPFPFFINQPLPSNAPSGTYTITFQLVNATTGAVCATSTTTVVIPAPRVGAVVAEQAEAPRVKGTPRTASAAVQYAPWEASASQGGFFASATTSGSEVTAYPNPFAGRTTLSFSASEATTARLAIYDVLGREVAVLVDGAVEAGSHTAVFDASALSAGTYVYRLVVGNDVHTGRVTVAH